MPPKMERGSPVCPPMEGGQRISQAAASIADTAAKLPEAVRVEREAAVKQVADELTAQRAGLLAHLEKSEAPTREILTHARATFEARAQFSTPLQGATVALDTFIGGFQKE